MQNNKVFSNWVEIELSAIEDNIRAMRRICEVPIMAVVKANGYGHGAISVARAATQGGAAWFGVARIEEALELRRGGIESPILVLGFTSPGSYIEAVTQRISMSVWTRDQIKEISIAALQAGLPAHIHLKVDTGMSRLGVPSHEAYQLAKVIQRIEGVFFEGIFTHFARADEIDRYYTDLQEQRFQKVIDQIKATGLEPPLVHAANSAATLVRPSSRFNLVRTGIAIYGLNPSKECKLPPGFRPSLAWKSFLTQVKVLPPGTGVSYGSEYITKSRERIGTVPVGYADGFRRVQGNKILVHGIRVPVVGRVCMDQISVQLDSVPEAEAGDEVILVGKQGESRITADDLAECWGTVNYEVVCGIGSRVPRLYIEG